MRTGEVAEWSKATASKAVDGRKAVRGFESLLLREPLTKHKMETKQREHLVNEVISRVINTAPINEVIRVYSLSVQKSLEVLSDQDLLEEVLKAGYTDILEKYSNLEEFIEGDSPPSLVYDGEESVTDE